MRHAQYHPTLRSWKFDSLNSIKLLGVVASFLTFLRSRSCCRWRCRCVLCCFVFVQCLVLAGQKFSTFSLIRIPMYRFNIQHTFSPSHDDYVYSRADELSLYHCACRVRVRFLSPNNFFSLSLFSFWSLLTSHNIYADCVHASIIQRAFLVFSCEKIFFDEKLSVLWKIDWNLSIENR